MTKPARGTGQEYPIITIYDDADKAATALLNVHPSNRSRYVVVEYPRDWGNHVGYSKSPKGCAFHFRKI